MSMIQKQNFGVEIEMTGITRAKAAQVMAEHFGTRSFYIGTYYDAYGAKDQAGRIWKTMSDGSIKTVYKVNGNQVSANRDYSCEVVTPILKYNDIEDLQTIVRKLRQAGAITNSSCGIHVHVDGANHDASSLTRLVNFVCSRQDLFYEALGIEERASRWCRKLSPELFKAMQNGEKTKSAMERVWYSPANDGYSDGIKHDHYNRTRYHGINLHAFFTKGTVEFRLFNGTLHAGKIKAYIQFCLAVSGWAIESDDRIRFVKRQNMTTEQKRKLMHNVLVKRLGMTGDEFKTARLHLEKAFAVEPAIGQSA